MAKGAKRYPVKFSCKQSFWLNSVFCFVFLNQTAMCAFHSPSITKAAALLKHFGGCHLSLHVN